MKTPSAPVPKKAKKPLREWLPPSPFTPMPPYDSMTTPELKVIYRCVLKIELNTDVRIQLYSLNSKGDYTK